MTWCVVFLPFEPEPKSERQRMQEADKVSGVFTGFYATHPITKKRLPIWVAEYVLGSYGTGAVMGVPAHDSRDKAFAQYFSLPIVSCFPI